MFAGSTPGTSSAMRYASARSATSRAGIQLRPSVLPFQVLARASSSTRLSVSMRSSVEFKELLVNMVKILVMMVRAGEKAALMPARVRHFDQFGVLYDCHSDRGAVIMTAAPKASSVRMIIRRPTDIPSSEITPEALYLN